VNFWPDRHVFVCVCGPGRFWLSRARIPIPSFPSSLLPSPYSQSCYSLLCLLSTHLFCLILLPWLPISSHFLPPHTRLPFPNRPFVPSGRVCYLRTARDCLSIYFGYVLKALSDSRYSPIERFVTYLV
jgi:hypothetical protein